MAMTMKGNLINTQVFTDSINQNLGGSIKFYPLSYVQNFDNTQVGSIAVPVYDWIGNAPIVAEGVAITPSLLTQSSADLPIVKVAKAVEITDEARASAYGNVMDEAQNQIVKSISAGIETQLVTALGTSTLTFTTPAGGLTSGSILAGMNLFGEEQDDEMYLVVNPASLADVKTDNAFADGKLLGMNLVVSSRIPAGTCYILKQGALGLYLARSVSVEQDRDILVKSTVISASCMFASHLRDSSKSLMITITP
jgi:hypothetical protein